MTHRSINKPCVVYIYQLYGSYFAIYHQEGCILQNGIFNLNSRPHVTWRISSCSWPKYLKVPSHYIHYWNYSKFLQSLYALLPSKAHIITFFIICFFHFKDTQHSDDSLKVHYKSIHPQQI